MVIFEKLVYPAFIKQEDEGEFGVYFPTLFPAFGWNFSLSEGETKFEAIKNAKKDLAFSLAGTLYDNESLPKPIPIQKESLSKGMELIDVETSFKPYFDEIQEHLIFRHWHIVYYIEEYEEEIEAIGYKNDQGKWDIFFGDYSKEEEAIFFDSSYKKNSEYPESIILFSVKLRSVAQEKFKHFVKNVILKHRTKEEWLERKKERLESDENFNKSVIQIIDEKVKNGEITEHDATLMIRELRKKTENE